jgi:hypothetical protein
MTTTTEEKLTIPMSERRPLKIVKSEWPKVASGSAFSGQHEFQAFDGARISVRRHADGRSIVYGYAGDWDGGGRPTRENRTAGFLVAEGEDEVRAIRRVAGILAETECVGEMAERAARDCIAHLPAESADEPGPPSEVRIPRAGALRLLRFLDELATSGPLGIDPRYRQEAAAIADELAAVVGGR